MGRRAWLTAASGRFAIAHPLHDVAGYGLASMRADAAPIEADVAELSMNASLPPPAACANVPTHAPVVVRCIIIAFLQEEFSVISETNG